MPSACSGLIRSSSRTGSPGSPSRSGFSRISRAPSTRPIETSLGAWLDRTVARLPEPVRAGARPVLRLVVIEIEAVWRHVATELLMQLATPSGDFDLGKDVPAPPGGPLFPEDLGAIRGPELVALLAEYDRTGGTGIGSGAEDWAKLPQRMNYILNLFRSRQQDGALLSPAVHRLPSGRRCRKDGFRPAISELFRSVAPPARAMR